MYKKLFTSLFAVALIFIFTGMGMARDYGCGPRTADVNLQFQASSNDVDHSARGNEESYGVASGYAGGTVDVRANADGNSCIYVGGYWEGKPWCSNYVWGHWEYAPNPAIAIGDGGANSDSHAWSWTRDYGTTSKAGAGAVTESDAWTSGLAKGKYGCRETVDSEVWVGGNVYQDNYAAETGYPNGQFVEGFNYSGGSFYANDFDYDSGRGYAYDYNWIYGKAITKGRTEVTIDSYGSYRSLRATTSNFTNITVSHGLQNANVYGGGFVKGIVQNGGTYGGGMSSFSYDGYTSGSGQATLNANIHTGGNSSSVTAHGSAYATGN